MIIVAGSAKVDPGSIARLRPVMRAMVDASRAEAGCVFYSLAVDDEAAGAITILEGWRDDAALRAHFATPHMAAFQAGAAGAILSVDAKIYDVAGERPLGFGGA